MGILRKTATAFAWGLLFSFSLTAAADPVQDANRLFKQGQYEQALDMVDAYLENSPKDAQARFLKGLIVNEQGKPLEAIGIFTALTNDYPELPEPYNNLAVLYAGQGQYEKAKVALEMAIRTHPSYATAHENLGDIYAKMASQAYDRALQLDKGNTATQTKLALIRELFDKGSRAARPSVATAVASAPASAAQSAVTASPAPIPAPPVVTAAAKPEVVSTKPAAPDTVPARSPAVSVVAPVVAPAAVAPAAAPVEAAPAAPTVDDVSAEIVAATQGWAQAWSGKNVQQYLSYYASEFKVPGGLSRGDWEAQRKDRLTKPKSIEVAVSDLKVTIVDSQRVKAVFKQNYRASHFKSVDRKTLVWVRQGGRWQIAEERAGG